MVKISEACEAVYDAWVMYRWKFRSMFVESHMQQRGHIRKFPKLHDVDRNSGTRNNVKYRALIISG